MQGESLNLKTFEGFPNHLTPPGTATVVDEVLTPLLGMRWQVNKARPIKPELLVIACISLRLASAAHEPYTLANQSWLPGKARRKRWSHLAKGEIN